MKYGTMHVMLAFEQKHVSCGRISEPLYGLRAASLGSVYML